MSCREWEPRIALWIEGDLPDRDAGKMEEHLRLCTGCRELAKELELSQAALRRLREEPANEAALSQVRRRVLEQVADRKPRWVYGLGWRHVLAAAVVVLAVGVALLSRSPRRTTEVKQVAASRSTFELPVRRQPEVRPAARARGTRHRRPARPQFVQMRGFEMARIEPPRIEPVRIDPPPSPNQTVVKLVTDDPDVVIVWLMDQNGGSQ